MTGGDGWLGSVFGPRYDGPDAGVRGRTPATRRDRNMGNSWENRSRRLLTAVLSLARVAVGLVALVGIVWLTRQLFT